MDWNWVRSEICKKFQNVKMGFLDNGEAVVEMISICEVEHIAVLPPLWTERGVVTFRRWRPTEGSLNLEHDRVDDFWICLKVTPELNKAWEGSQVVVRNQSRIPFRQAEVGGEQLGTTGPLGNMERPITYAQVATSSPSRPPGFEQVQAQRRSEITVRQDKVDGGNGLEAQKVQNLGSQCWEDHTPIHRSQDLLDPRRDDISDEAQSRRTKMFQRSHALSKTGLSNQFWTTKAQRWFTWRKCNNQKRPNRRGNHRSKSRERTLSALIVSPTILSRKGKELVVEGVQNGEEGGITVVSDEGSFEGSDVVVSLQPLNGGAPGSSVVHLNGERDDNEVEKAMPNNEDLMAKLKKNLMECTSEEQIEMWIKRLVSPLAKQLGVVGVGNSNEMEQLCRDLCRGDLSLEKHDECFGDLPMDDPEENEERNTNVYDVD
ncbi:hypothetical protein FRX31_028320 [Thalictrum thalictroides]|uniref:Uncharacterized protein n=1 Tax=Thalictrum thalictroides TaxID=46969 RepID=A0A7J6VAI1_THATH|nr:hypothetical protein FRX31_028320 [Thalictrum thalictroides]